MLKICPTFMSSSLHGNRTPVNTRSLQNLTPFGYLNRNDTSKAIKRISVADLLSAGLRDQLD
jgi:hypothetical protein